MIFYHVSTDLQHSGKFVPRIPENRHKQAEDASIGRVCVCPTLEQCFSAMPGGGINLYTTCNDARNYFLVFKIDTEKLGINEKNIITSKVLFEKDLVRDAEASEEHWICEPFIVPEEDSQIIAVQNWNEEICDVIPHHIYELADREYEGNYLEAYEDYYDENVPCGTIVENLEYFTENVKQGTEIPLYYDDKHERDCILNCLKDIPCTDIHDNDMDIIKFTVTEDTNLRNLFLTHHKEASLYL